MVPSRRTRTGRFAALLLTVLALVAATLVPLTPASATGASAGSPSGAATADRPGREPRVATAVRGIGVLSEVETDSTISGLVYDEDGNLVDNVLVEAVPWEQPDADPIASDLTYEEGDSESHGAYKLYVPAGDYVVRFSTGSDYWGDESTKIETLYYGGGSGTKVAVGADEDVELAAVTVRPDAGTTLSGVVRDSNGDLLAGAEVALVRATRSGFYDYYWSDWTTTDAQGRYTFTGVNRGHRYAVRAYGGWLDNGDEDGGYTSDADTFLGGTPFFEDATRIQVPTGSTGVTAPELRMVPGSTITGRVVDQDGQPLDRWYTEVDVLARTPSGSVQYVGYAYEENEDERGTFTGHRIPRGVPITLYSYEAQKYLGDVEDPTDATFETLGQDVATFDFGTIVLTRAGRLVTGRVVTPEGEPLDDHWVRLVTIDGPDDYWSVRGTYTDANGRYRLYAPWNTGEPFSVMTEDDDGNEVFLGGGSEPATAVTFTATRGQEPYEAQDLVVTTSSPRIRGIVRDEDGQPVAHAQVRLYTDDGDGYWDWWTSTTTDTQGRYVFRWVDTDRTYSVGAMRDGGIEVFAGDGESVASLDDARRITPSAGQVVGGVDIDLFRPVNSISGSIVLPDGTAADWADTYARVALYRWDEDFQDWDWNDSTYVYDSLDYAFSGLPAGDYYVSIDFEAYDDEGNWLRPYLTTTSAGGYHAPAGPDAPGVVSIPDDGPATLDVTMDPGLELSGVASIAGSDPVVPARGVEVNVDSTDWTFHAWTETDDRGRYAMRVPRQTNLTLRAYAGALGSISRDFATADTDVVEDLAFTPDWGAVGSGTVERLEYCLSNAGSTSYELGGQDLYFHAYRGHLTAGYHSNYNAHLNRFASLMPLSNSFSRASSGLSPDGKTLCLLWNDTSGEDSTSWWGNVYQALVTVDPDGGLDVTYNYDQIEWTNPDSRAGHGNGLAPFESATFFPDATTKGDDLEDYFYDENWEEIPNDKGLVHNSLGSETPGQYVFDYHGFDLGAAPVATSRPTIVGQPTLGQPLTVEPPTWEVDGVAADDVQMVYRWRVNGQPVATGATYTPQQSDFGKRIAVRVQGYVPGRKLGSVYSKRSRVQGEAVATNTTPPALNGTVGVGNTVTATSGDWDLHPSVDPSEVDRELEWLIDGYHEDSGESFTIPAWAAGSAVAVRERLSADGFAPVAATSAAVRVPMPDPVTNVVPPTLSVEGGGEVRVGSVLQVNPGTWTPAGANFSYRWSVGGLQRNGSTTYTVAASDLGKRVAVRVTASAPGHADGSLSTSVGPVLAADETTATVTGSVRDDSDVSMSGVDWSACGVTPAGEWTCFPGGKTNAGGSFTFEAPVGMELWVTVWDRDLGSMERTLTVPEGGESVTFTFVRPTPPPPNVEVPSGNGTVGGVPSVYYGEAQTFEVTGCVTPDARWDVEFANGAAPMTGTMTKVEDLAGGLAKYRAVIPAFYPNHDYATVSFTVRADCDPKTPPTEVVIYIDPSGIVTDQYGNPLVGATVTLLRSDTAGGQFTTVPDGDTSIMDPTTGLVNGAPGSGARNPKPTDNTGFFRWDVVEGFYKVRAEHPGCTTTTTNEMQVNPPRVDLLIKMQCADAVAPTAEVRITGDVDGKAPVGTELTADPAPVTAPQVSSLQWLRDGQPIEGATGTEYTVTAEDVDADIQVAHTVGTPPYAQEEGRGSTVTFESTTERSEVVVGAAPAVVATVLPGITGSGKVGTDLTATDGEWSVGGLDFTRQWLRDGAEIDGATGTTYTVAPADLAAEIAVRVTAKRTGYEDGTATSDTVTGLLGDAPTTTARPTITGAGRVGTTLTATSGVWNASGLTYRYQWLRNGRAIPGATTSTYTVTTADAAAPLTVRVQALRSGYATGQATSAPRTIPKIATRTVLRAPKKVRAAKKGKLVVRVTAAGTKPTGQVRLFRGKKALRTLTLRNGVARTQLRFAGKKRKKATKHKLRAVYLGSTTFGRSTSKTVTVTAVRGARKRR